MQFLNPFILFGLGAVAVPIVLHFLNLRKLKTIEFSTLTFLKELQTTKVKKLKLRQWLLLLLRTLLIIFLVLAFSRPTTTGNFFNVIGSDAKTTAIIIIDNSLSTNIENENGNILNQIKNTGIKILNSLKDGDECVIITTSKLDNKNADFLHDISFLKKTISEIKPSQKFVSLNSIFEFASSLISKSKNANKEIYFLSDFQSSNLSKENLEKIFSSDIKIFLGKFFADEGNIAIDTCFIENKILDSNSPIKIDFTIKNFSDMEHNNLTIDLFLGDEMIAQKNISIASHQSKSNSFSVVLNKTGFINLKIEIESDVLDLDNTRYISFYIPERINIAFVSQTEKDILYPVLALNSFDKNYFEIKKVFNSTITQVDFNETDVLVLSNINNFFENDVSIIKKFLENGGGLIFFVGDNSNIENINTKFFKLLKIATISNVISSQNNSAIASFGYIDFAHPIFNGVFDNDFKKDNINSPKIFKIAKRNFGDFLPIISTQDNTPILSEEKIGDGTLLFYSIAPEPKWSEFPRKGIFLPLIYRSILYSTLKNEKQKLYNVGETINLELNTSKISNTNQLKIIGSNNFEEILNLENKNSDVQISEREEVGNFLIKSQEKILSTYSINIDTKESNLISIDDKKLQSICNLYGFENKNIIFENDSEKIQTSIIQSRFGSELWKVFLVIAFCLAILEMLVSRTSKKEISE